MRDHKQTKQRKRLFVAILLPAHVEAHLDDAVDPLRTALPGLRWTRPSNWHLTLEFLGDCGPHEAERQRLRWEERAASSAPMELQIAGSGTFPATTRAKVLWTGLSGDVLSWQKLAGPEQEPHLTLARAREPQDLTGLVDSLSRYAGPVWEATQLALVASHLRGRDERGPRYEPLEYVDLGS